MTGIKEVVNMAESQSSLARQLGVTPQAVQGWVNAGYVPLARAVELEKMYGVPAINLVSPKNKRIFLSV